MQWLAKPTGHIYILGVLYIKSVVAGTATILHILKYLLHMSTTYTNVTQGSMQWLAKPKRCT